MNLQYILKIFLTVFTLLVSVFSICQEKNEEKVKHFREVVLKKDFKNLYSKQLRRVRRVYPLALEAAKLIQQIDQELESIDS